MGVLRVLTRQLIVTITILQSLVIGLYMSEPLLTVISLIAALGIILITFFRFLSRFFKTHDKKQSLNNVLTRTRFVLFYYFRVTRKAQLRSIMFLAVVTFLLFFGIFSLDVMSRDVLTRVTNAHNQTYGQFIDTIAINTPQLTWGIDPDFSKNPIILVEEIKTNVASWITVSNENVGDGIMTADAMLVIPYMEVQVNIARPNTTIPLSTSADLLVLPDDHWLWEEIGLHDEYGQDIIQKKFITLNIAGVNEQPEEGWDYLTKHGLFTPQKVLPFNMTDASGAATIEVNSTNLHTTLATYSVRDVRNLLDKLGFGVIGISESVNFHALLLVSETMFARSFKDFPYNTAFNRITFIVQVWFSFNRSDHNPINPLETTSLDDIDAAYHQWSFTYYQEQGITDLVDIEEKIRSQPFFYKLLDAKYRMNKLLVLAALEMVVVILFTSVIVYTEFITFSADKKREAFHKLVLRGLSMKKHIPYIITIERIFLLIGSGLFGLIFTAVMITIQEVIRILLPSFLVISLIITCEQVFEVLNRPSVVTLLVAAILQLFIIMIMLHQISFNTLLRKSQFTIGGSGLLTSSATTSMQPLISAVEGQSNIQKKFNKFQHLIHVIGFILLILLSEFARWIQAATSSSQVVMLKALIFYMGLLLVTSAVFTYYPRIITHVSQKLYLKNKSVFFAARSILMRILTEKPPAQLRLLIILTIALTLLTSAHLNIQKDQQLALSQSFTNIGADIRISDIDASNYMIINQIQSIDGVNTISPLKVALIRPTDGSKTYAFHGLELKSFLSILEQRKDLVDADVLTSVNALKSKAEQLSPTSNISLDNPIPVLFHRQLQEELNIDPGSSIILSIPSRNEVGRQRYDLKLEIIDFFTNFPGITATTTDILGSNVRNFEIPLILPAQVLNALINATSLPASEQDEYVLLTVTEDAQIDDVMQELYSLFELNPVISIEKRLTSSDMEEVLYQLDIYESIRMNQMQMLIAFIMLVVIIASFIQHLRQWIHRYEQLALLFGATPASLRREYLLELAFHVTTVAVLAELMGIVLLIISTGITALTPNDYLHHALTMLVPIFIGSALIIIGIATFILFHPIKVSKATLPRFTN